MAYEDILQRMLARVPNTFDKREGSVIWNGQAPAAVELELLHIEAEDIINESFADTASREFLIRRAAERGIVPDEPTNAVLQGEFTPPTIDVTGKRFNLPNQSINYIVTENISPGIYKVKCETAGIIGNQYLGQIIPIDYISGLETAELTALLIPGEDEQDTESLREEYFSSFSVKRYGGNIEDYIGAANDISGVGATLVTPIWNGGGTVKLTILNSNYDPASQVLIDTVQEIIAPEPYQLGLGKAPIGHLVTVESAITTEINITTNIEFATGYNWTSVEQSAIATIEDYMLELREFFKTKRFVRVTPNGIIDANPIVVRISQIETRLLAIQGISDVGNTEINGSANNLTLTPYAIPILGGITPR